MAYSYPANWTSPADMMTWTNEVTLGYGGAIICFALWLVIFLTMKESYSGLRAVTTANFLTTLAIILLRTGGWVSDAILYLGIIVTAISAAMLWKEA